jgi:predicted DNA-binding transcriptional regulator YafY
LALYDELDVVNRALLQLAHRPTHLGSSDIASDTRLESRFLHIPDVSRSYLYKGAELDDLFRAVADLRVVSLLYAGRAERVVLHAYAMVLYRGAVHAVGLDVAAGKVDTFLLDRIRDTQTSDETRFELPPEFDADDFVHGAFGVAPPGLRSRVTIEFDPRVAEGVRAERVHPTQRIAAAPDGRVRLTMTLPLTDGLVAWILGFGPSARVIEPRELRDRIAERLRAALGRYEG